MARAKTFQVAPWTRPIKTCFEGAQVVLDDSDLPIPSRFEVWKIIRWSQTIKGKKRQRVKWEVVWSYGRTSYLGRDFPTFRAAREFVVGR